MGEVCIVPEGLDCCLGQRMVLIKPNPQKVDHNFLLYSLLSDYLQQQIGGSKNSGSIVSNLRIPLLKDLRIPKVPLNTQQKIGSILSTLDAKIELNNWINGELEAMAKALYDYWFVQFDFPYDFASGRPSVGGQPYKSSGGRMAWNEALKREVPVGWEVGSVSELFQINPSMTLKAGQEASYFDMDALPTEGFMTKEKQRKPYSGGVKFQNGDVVVARITPCLENGKTALITLLDGNETGFGSTEFIILRGKKQPLSAFGAFVSRSDLFRKYAIGNMLGTSGRKRVEGKMIGLFPLAIPPSNLLSEFEEMVAPTFQKMTLNTKENQQLAQLRDWLLPMLMNGQVEV